jgi:hypothetical protein
MNVINLEKTYDLKALARYCCEFVQDPHFTSCGVALQLAASNAAKRAFFPVPFMMNFALERMTKGKPKAELTTRQDDGQREQESAFWHRGNHDYLVVGYFWRGSKAKENPGHVGQWCTRSSMPTPGRKPGTHQSMGQCMHAVAVHDEVDDPYPSRRLHSLAG